VKVIKGEQQRGKTWVHTGRHETHGRLLWVSEVDVWNSRRRSSEHIDNTHTQSLTDEQYCNLQCHRFITTTTVSLTQIVNIPDKSGTKCRLYAYIDMPLNNVFPRSPCLSCLIDEPSKNWRL